MNSQTPVTSGSLDSIEANIESRIEKLQEYVDELFAVASSVDDRQLLEETLSNLFEKIAVEEDALEAVRQYRSERCL